MLIVVQYFCRITIHTVNATFTKVACVQTRRTIVLIAEISTHSVVSNSRHVAFEIIIFVQLVEIKIGIGTVVFAFHIIGGNKLRHNGVHVSEALI